MDPIKEEPKAQAPADAAAPKAEVIDTGKATGLVSMTREQLQDLYKKTPELFEGVIPAPEKKVEEKKPEPTPQSAAPAYEGVEIKLPTDVPVNTELVNEYLKFAKENGLSPKVVQAQIDWQTNQARTYAKTQKTPEAVMAEQDATNVGVLKKEFGAKYDENMETARQAAKEFAGPEILERLKTSDPVLVRHFLQLGKKNAEDTTKHGAARTGDETAEADKAARDAQRARYPNTKFET